MAEIGCASVKLGDEVQIKLGDHVVESDVVVILRDGEWWRIVALRPVDVPDFAQQTKDTVSVMLPQETPTPRDDAGGDDEVGDADINHGEMQFTSFTSSHSQTQSLMRRSEESIYTK